MVRAKVAVAANEKQGSYYPATLTLVPKHTRIDDKRLILNARMNSTAEIKIWAATNY